jgi:hypothetical protein
MRWIQYLQSRQAKKPMQGLWRQWHLRTWQAKEKMQGLQDQSIAKKKRLLQYLYLHLMLEEKYKTHINIL